MLKNKFIGFIGSGNMGEALLGGLLNAGLTDPDHLICSDVDEGRLKDLNKRFGVQISQDNISVIRRSDIVVFALKPQVMPKVVSETVKALDEDKVIISIAAGVPMAAIADRSDKLLRIIRAMPNVNVFVSEGATAIAACQHAKAEDLELATAIFNSVGRCVTVQSEGHLDAVTGLSGSGPAYGFIMIEALADGGVKMGLTRGEALLLAAQTLLGAAKMHLETGKHPGQLKDMVTSPGGTTIAGVHALEKGGLRSILMDAVESATRRSMELGAVARKG